MDTRAGEILKELAVFDKIEIKRTDTLLYGVMYYIKLHHEGIGCKFEVRAENACLATGLKDVSAKAAQFLDIGGTPC